MNDDGPQTVTIQAAYKGKTESYTFTVTDHFSPRELHASVVMGNDIYVIGGVTQKFFRIIGGSITPQISSDEVWRSSDDGLTWDQVAGGTRFTERGNHEAVVLNGALYVIAGTAGGGGFTALDDVWRSTDRGVNWSRVTPAGGSVEFPMDHGFASAVLGSAMYVMGGIQRTPFMRLDEVWKSTDRGVTWTHVNESAAPSDKFSARSGHAAVVLRSAGAAKLYVIGGRTTSGAGADGLDDVWESSDGTSWAHVNASAASRDKFPARREHSAAAVGDTVYVIAGRQGGTGRRDVWKSADKGAAWTQVVPDAELFPPRLNHSSAAQGGALYVIGGSSSAAVSGTLFNDVWRSTDGGQTWVNVYRNP